MRGDLEGLAADHVLAVGDEDDDFAALALALEELGAGGEAFADGGAGGVIGFAEGIESPFVIEGEGADEKWAAGEADDADAVVGAFGDEFGDDFFEGGAAIGAFAFVVKIHFSHGAAVVEGEHDVDAFGGIGQVAARGAGAGEGEAEEGEGEQWENPAIEAGVAARGAAEAFEGSKGWKRDGGEWAAFAEEVGESGNHEESEDEPGVGELELVWLWREIHCSREVFIGFGVGARVGKVSKLSVTFVSCLISISYEIYRRLISSISVKISVK